MKIKDTRNTKILLTKVTWSDSVCKNLCDLQLYTNIHFNAQLSQKDKQIISMY